ncbi:MAG: transglycosylase domain-containing protein [Actinomycetota bacterium]|nr:transglycosylase domain-containing protein [Actinomycetota bacterium]
MVRSFRRLLRLPVLLMMVIAFAVLLTTVGLAIAPHSKEALFAVERERVDVALNLSPGAQRTEVYGSDGNEIGILRYDIDRELVKIGQVPENVLATLLAVEDNKFWLHNGVDIRAISRAMIQNVTSGGITQGGSTITQQIVKLRIVGNESSFSRKIREAVLAARLEEEFTKQEILEFYLNEIYFGNGAYGLQAAAETYFGKDVDELDVGDAALLAGLIRSPGIFDGFDDTEVVGKRRSMSLQSAEDAGVIDAEERKRFEERGLPDRNRSPQRTDETLRRDYFLDEVTEALLKHPALGETYQERFAKVYNGGLRVWTTFDATLQRQMEAAVREVLPEGTGDFEVAMASVDPSSGAVRAFIGGPEFAEFQFNLVTQGRRQPGSSFKTYVLAAAVEKAGLFPFDTVSGKGPCTFPNPPNVDYEVDNFNESDGVVGTVQFAVLKSSNCGFVRLGLRTGLENVVEVANRLLGRNAENSFRPYLSLSLGAQEVTPLEQAVAYAAIANGGLRMEPYYISKIEDASGSVLYQHVPRGRRAIKSTTAAWVTEALEQNVIAGTGRRAQLESGQLSAGKTGTSQDFSDAWYVGFTPHLSTSVWMGHPEEKVSMTDIQGRDGTGGWVPARIWGAYMTRVLEGQEVLPFTEPPPPQRNSQLLYLSDEMCAVDIQLDRDRDAMQFDLPCSMVEVDLNSGSFVAHPEANCRITELSNVGVHRDQYLNCGLVSGRNPVTTTTVPSEEKENGT